MAHFAKVKDGKVLTVIVADQDFVDSYDDGIPGQWIKTSYNTLKGVHYTNGDFSTPSDTQEKALRKNFACEGYVYDRIRDAFYAPQPYPSWTLNETTCDWEPPVAYPTDGESYTWNEETQSWDAVTE